MVTGSVGSGISGLRFARSSSSPIGSEPSGVAICHANVPPARRAEATAVAETPSARARWAKRRRLSRPVATCRSSSSSSPCRPAGVQMFFATKTSFVTRHTPRVASLPGGPLDPPVCLNTRSPGDTGDAGVAPTDVHRLAILPTSSRLRPAARCSPARPAASKAAPADRGSTRAPARCDRARAGLRSYPSPRSAGQSWSARERSPRTAGCRRIRSPRRPAARGTRPAAAPRWRRSPSGR